MRIVVIYNGPKLPTDDFEAANTALVDLEKRLRERGVVFCTNRAQLGSAAAVNAERYRLEALISNDEEIEFAQDVLDAIECTEEDFELGQDMPLLPALVIVKNLTEEQKSVVSDVISATIVADRVITLEEAVVFDYVSELTGIDDILDKDEREHKESLNDLASEAD